MNTRRTFWTRYGLVCVLAALALTAGAQRPQPERRDDKYKEDPMAYCRKGPDDPETPSVHGCSCSLICSEGTDQVPSHQTENTACQMYCSRQRCLCYPDNPCDTPIVL
jgi:hypothetical protein